MAELSVTITENTIIGRLVEVKGTAAATADSEPRESAEITRLTVRVGNGPALPAGVSETGGAATWTFSGTLPDGTTGGTLLRITATVHGRFRLIGETEWTALPPRTDSVSVRVERQPPVLTLDPYPNEVTITTASYRLTLSGSARDQAGVEAVRWRIGSAPLVAAENLGGDWSRWQAVIEVPPGDHVITIEAADTFGNTATLDAPIHVRSPFEPSTAELAFAETTYLQELIGFAGRRIKVGASGSGPTATDLAAQLFQPFDRLTALEFYEAARLPHHQTRLAVEVLRKHAAAVSVPVPPRVERQFRAAVYEWLLLLLGTSAEELRIARVADAPLRRALAERLGFGLEGTRPDRLDRITQVPEDVTVAQLEQLFGFARTTNADPLGATSLSAAVLNWRIAEVRDRWASEDDQRRDVFGDPLPIVDPDLVTEANLRSSAPGDRVYTLWQSRQRWLAQALRDVEEAQPQGLEHVIRTSIGELDFEALETQDNDGVDIRPVLDPLKLELAAFRHLARCRDLAGTSGLLDTEWRDIRDIVVQVQKRRLFSQWREQEAGLTISPDRFRLEDDSSAGRALRELATPWRITWSAHTAWRDTLVARDKELEQVEDAYRSAVDAAEVRALPLLRNSLIETLAGRQTPAEETSAAAARLSRELAIDFRANGAQKTTRVDQAIATLQQALFSVRAGRLAQTQSPMANWSIDTESEFDREWQWMGTYTTWHAAMMVFAYPENQLLPSLFVREEPFLAPTDAFLEFIAALRNAFRLTPGAARAEAEKYLTDLRAERPDLPAELRSPAFGITENLDPVERRALVAALFQNAGVVEPHREPNYLREVFWLVPIAVALALQRSGHYLTALDWYRTVYAFNLGSPQRKVYRGLALEESIQSVYSRVPEWLVEELNPHIFARSRRNAYSNFTVGAIVRCVLAYADEEFSRGTPDALGRALTLYQLVEDLLNLPDASVETGATVPFLPNPVWQSFQLQARAGVSKIQSSMNIAGFAAATAAGPPTQYRYPVLAERAKQLTATAQQIESAYLAALERRDAEAYNLLQARHDLQVARATVSLQDLRVTDAALGVRIAELQRNRAGIQAAFYSQQLSEGLSSSERAALAAMRSAIRLQQAASELSIVGSVWGAAGLLTGAPLLGSLFGGPSQVLSAFSSAASLNATLYQSIASFERHREDWQQQFSVARQDLLVSEQQILVARNQREIALMERAIAGLQLDHAAAVVQFLVNKFTNAELYEWMSGVLGGIYRFFLQQATAVAQLAQLQLSFERQEPALSVIHSDYWTAASESPTGESEPDRAGLTGSARLLQDLHRLDQYAFETKQRKLQLTQTLSLAQLAPLELQDLRETGRMVFVTPMELFDRDFPGHYLRLIRRVRLSMLALVPPVRGLRGTLTASGLSRVVSGGDTFTLVTLRRPPETIAFTSPVNATGLFELEPEGEMLLPFEGAGVETSWELHLPKPGNPFDYQTIADVMLTIEYTALDSAAYRRQVIARLGRRLGGDRMFSFREQFADAWYELHNSDALATSFVTRRADFPPHLGDLHIEHVSLRVLRQEGFVEEIDVRELGFTPGDETAPVGGAARTVAGTITTRRRSGEAWRPLTGKDPFGHWTFRLANTPSMRAWLKDGLIEDMALAITFSGTHPGWVA